MRISGTNPDVANQFAVRVQKLAQDQEKREGQQAVTLIEQSTPQVGSNGEGTHINTYA